MFATALFAALLVAVHGSVEDDRVAYVGNDVVSREYSIDSDARKVYLIAKCPLPAGRIVGFSYYVNNLPEHIRAQFLIFEAHSNVAETHRYALKFHQKHWIEEQGENVVYLNDDQTWQVDKPGHTYAAFSFPSLVTDFGPISFDLATEHQDAEVRIFDLQELKNDTKHLRLGESYTFAQLWRVRFSFTVLMLTETRAEDIACLVRVQHASDSQLSYKHLRGDSGSKESESDSESEGSSYNETAVSHKCDNEKCNCRDFLEELGEIYRARRVVVVDGQELAVDRNECNLGVKGGCSQECHDTWNGYFCECQPGYQLVLEHDVCPKRKQHCRQWHGRQQCYCSDGSTLSPAGYRCKDVDECSSQHTPNGGCQHYCVNTPGSHNCTCAPGYLLAADQRKCVDEDECLRHPCSPSSHCVNTPGSYFCVPVCQHCGNLTLAAYAPLLAAGPQPGDAHAEVSTLQSMPSGAVVAACVLAAGVLLAVVVVVALWVRRKHARSGNLAAARAGQVVQLRSTGSPSIAVVDNEGYTALRLHGSAAAQTIPL